MKKEKILITWGLGFVGSHTAVVFNNAGYEIILLDDMSNSYLETLWNIKELSPNTVSFYEVDLKNKDQLRKVLKENKDITGIIHCSGKKSPIESRQDPFLYYNNNIIASITLFKTIKELKITPNIIFSSAGSIYDTNKQLPPYAESDSINPNNPYDNSKFIIEQILRDLTSYKWFNAINLRYFSPIGAHHSGLLWEQPKGIPTNLVPFAYKVAKGDIEELQIFGNDYNTNDGTAIRDYIHIMDVAEANLLAFQYIHEFTEYKKSDNNKSNKGLFDTFNIWSGAGTSIKEIIRLIEEITETKVPYKITKRREWDAESIVSNSQKAKQILWRESKRSIYQALEDWWRFVYKSSY